MRILGIDYGDARTGLSISDPSEFLAGSPSVIHEWNYDKLVEKLVAFIEQNKIGEIVLGHPLNMDGTVGPRAEKCQALAKALEDQGGRLEFAPPFFGTAVKRAARFDHFADDVGHVLSFC